MKSTMKKPKPPRVRYVTEGEDPRKKGGKKKVYCKRCKWLKNWNMGTYLGAQYPHYELRCDHPDNYRKAPDTSLEKGGLVLKKSCFTINEKNNCGWYKRKWYLLQRGDV